MLQLSETPGVNLDDRLRTVPGFTLFRRNSSIIANPTTQGVSLRGLGGSGASRTLLLWDGVPMNDPFGGWVYWTRFTPDDINEVNIARGASTSLFGDRAMGGAITLLSRQIDSLRFNAAYEAGSENTHEAAVGLAGLWRRAAVSGNVRAFSTDGYFIVPASVRGLADSLAGVRFVAGNTRLDLFQGDQRFSMKLDFLAEDRANGTVLTRNSTSLGTLSGNYSWQRKHDSVAVMGFHTREEFRASFSSVTNSRNTERITYTQQVPSEGTGAAAFWSHDTPRFTTLAGADVERDEGYSTDRLVPTGRRFGGGVRLQHGVFGEVSVKTGIVKWFGGARHHFTGGGDTFFSPSAGFVAGRGRLRARGSVYRSFRAPTLNELFRDFSVGNTTTQANAALRPEKMYGGEVGLDLIGESRRLSFTLFRNELTDLITNVTLRTGAQIVRQRQNATAATAQGMEANFRQSWGNWRGELSYMYVDSTYVTALRVPQVPRNQGSAQLAYQHKGTTASAGLRSYSLQFEDDLNAFILPGFSMLQFAASQRLTRGFSLVLAFENLLDRQYLTGFSPTPTIGAPRQVRAGVKWQSR